MWTACIAHMLYQVLKKEDDDVERFEAVYHVLSWGVPALLAILLAVTDSFGDAGPWCVIIIDISLASIELSALGTFLNFCNCLELSPARS